MPQLKPKPITLCYGAGLYLNIKSNGTKQWLYRFYWEGIQKRISLGLYPTVDLKKARSLRQQAQDMLSQGIDPCTGRKSSSKASYIQENRSLAPTDYLYHPRTPNLSSQKPEIPVKPL